MRSIKVWLPVLIAGFMIGLPLGLGRPAGLALAQSKVDQGRPGTQGPWPVTISAGGGGSEVVSSRCSSQAHKIATVGTSATNCPATQLASRRFVVICNSLENTGTPLLKVRTDGTDPIIGNTTAGDVLGIGDCIQYEIPAGTVPRCIANAASTAAHSYECVQP